MTQNEELIYHITARETWENALQSGSYTADSLETEGFIHASTRQQIIATANRFYAGKHGLVVLEIASARVRSEIRYEAVPDGELFPHIYGALDPAAVIRVLPFEPRADGTFVWHEG